MQKGEHTVSFSYISHLYCPKCEASYPPHKQAHLCACGSPLLAAYRLDELKASVRRSELAAREPSLWRYHELLPVEQAQNIISLREGFTPLLPLPRLGRRISIPHLYLKDDGLLPTGSFKARGAAVGVSKAMELGVRELALPTNGNAGAAWALYAARAGIRSTVVMPVDAPAITRSECAIAGARLHLVKGLISDAGKIVAQAISDDDGLYDASTLKEPYRIEGKKTIGFEIVEQFGWKLPDVIVYPTGGGVGLIGIYKALTELQALSWVQGKLPRFVAVQSAGCAPIVEAWKNRQIESTFWPQASTIAFGINVPKALGDFLVLDALYQTEGCAIAIDDRAILEEQRLIAELEGAFICPEGASTLVAARRLRDSGWIQDSDSVVVINTGLGLKYPHVIQTNIPVIKPGDRLNSKIDATSRPPSQVGGNWLT
nr:threonine synthase [Paenibacillus alvei]